MNLAYWGLGFLYGVLTTLLPAMYFLKNAFRALPACLLVFSPFSSLDLQAKADVSEYLTEKSAFVLEVEIRPVFQETGLGAMLARPGVQDTLLNDAPFLIPLVDALTSEGTSFLGLNLDKPVTFVFGGFIPNFEYLSDIEFFLLASVVNRTEWETGLAMLRAQSPFDWVALSDLPSGKAGFRFMLPDDDSTEEGVPLFAIWDNETLYLGTEVKPAAHALDRAWFAEQKALIPEQGVARFHYNPAAVPVGTGVDEVDEMLGPLLASPIGQALFRGAPGVASLVLEPHFIRVNAITILEEGNPLKAFYEGTFFPEMFAGETKPLLIMAAAANMPAIRLLVETLLPDLTEQFELGMTMDSPLPIVSISLREVLGIFRGDFSIALETLAVEVSEMDDVALEASIKLGLDNPELARGLLSVYAGFFNMMEFGNLTYTIENNLLDLRFQFTNSGEASDALIRLANREWSAETRGLLGTSSNYFFWDLAALRPLLAAIAELEEFPEEGLAFLEWVSTLEEAVSYSQMVGAETHFSNSVLSSDPTKAPLLPALIRLIEGFIDPMARDPFEILAMEGQRQQFQADPAAFKASLAGTWLIWVDEQDGEEPMTYFEIRTPEGRYETFAVFLDDNDEVDRELEETGNWDTNGWTVRYISDADEEGMNYGFAEGIRARSNTRVDTYSILEGEISLGTQIRVTDDAEQIKALILGGKP
jgi:hypothetical protein